MSHGIPESDWKKFRKLREKTLERFCARTLQEICQIANDDTGSAHQRYGDIYGLINERDKVLRLAFDGASRSKAALQLTAMVTRGLIKPEELATFSEETQHRVS